MQNKATHPDVESRKGRIPPKQCHSDVMYDRSAGISLLSHYQHKICSEKMY